MAKQKYSGILLLRRKGLTAPMEDYLKAIYSLQQKGMNATTLALAKEMKVSPPSATSMMKKLADWKLVRHTLYLGVRLTPLGEKIALEVIRHHRLLELYLSHSLGYSWDEVHQEAEKLEHFISEDFESRMSQALGNPKRDPHGAPIPTKKGTWEEIPSFSLASASPKNCLIMQEVEDEDPELLRYLSQLGLYPGVEISVLEKHPFEGPLYLRIGKSHHYLGHKVADRIRVILKKKRRKEVKEK